MITKTHPNGNEGGLIVRNIPSGIQEVTGDITAAADPAVLTALDDLLTELAQKFEAGQSVVVTSVGGSVAVTGTFWQATQPVSLASVPSHAVTGPLTDAELRATPVPISGTVTITDGAGAVNVIIDSGVITTITNTVATDPIDDPTRDLGKVDIASLDQYTPVSGRLPVDGSGVTQPVSVAATLNVDVTDEPARDNGKIDVASLDQYTPVSGRLPVDGSGVTQPVSGTVTANQGTAGSTDWRSDLRRGQTILFAPIDTATIGDQTIVAADVSNKIKVLSYSLVCDGTVAVRWKSGATTLSGAMAFVANTGIASPVASPAGGHLLETAVNNALILNLSAGIGVRGHVSYFLEA